MARRPRIGHPAYDHIHWRLLGCSTGGCLTIQIEQKLFDDLKSWDVRLRLCSMEN